jgi:hypothetical protein
MLLFTPERNHWVEQRGPPCRKPAGQPRNEQQQDDACKCYRISGAHTEQQVFQQARQGEGREQYPPAPRCMPAADHVRLSNARHRPVALLMLSGGLSPTCAVRGGRPLIYRFQEKEFHHEVTKCTKKLERNTGILGRFLRFLRFFVVYFS